MLPEGMVSGTWKKRYWTGNEKFQENIRKSVLETGNLFFYRSETISRFMILYLSHHYWPPKSSNCQNSRGSFIDQILYTSGMLLELKITLCVKELAERWGKKLIFTSGTPEKYAVYLKKILWKWKQNLVSHQGISSWKWGKMRVWEWSRILDTLPASNSTICRYATE